MEHVVFFTAPDGATAFRRVAGLEDAVRLVEHLRNVEGLHQVSVHPLGEEVPLAFRTWYRVEVPAADAAPSVPEQAVAPEAQPVPLLTVEDPAEDVAEPAPADEVAEPVVEPVLEQVEPVAEEAPEPVPAVVGPREDLKSLGFFAT